jgi:uncharacterized membrane protein YqjE
MTGTPAGLLASLRGLATTAADLLRTRLELFKLEAHEEAGRLTGLFVWGVAAVLLMVVGATFSAVFLTVLLWDSQRLLALGIFSALFLAAAGLAIFMTLRLARQGSQLFAGSLAELRQDVEALRPDQAQEKMP